MGCAEMGHGPEHVGEASKALPLTGQPTRELLGGSETRRGRLISFPSVEERASSNEPDTWVQSCLGYFKALQLWTSWSLRFLTYKMGTANVGLGVVMKMIRIMYR